MIIIITTIIIITIINVINIISWKASAVQLLFFTSLLKLIILFLPYLCGPLLVLHISSYQNRSNI